jgi:hypothetical protein
MPVVHLHSAAADFFGGIQQASKINSDRMSGQRRNREEKIRGGETDLHRAAEGGGGSARWLDHSSGEAAQQHRWPEISCSVAARDGDAQVLGSGCEQTTGEWDGSLYNSWGLGFPYPPAVSWAYPLRIRFIFFFRKMENRQIRTG